MRAVASSRLGCEFNKFLHASLGDDNNGVPLTVLSALARMDVDPWKEASNLAKMTPESAVTQLASLLGALRNAPAAGPESKRLARTLIALLPRPRNRAPPMLRVFAQAPPTKHPAAVTSALTFVTYVFCMLLIQWLMLSLIAHRQAQAKPTSAPTIDSPSPATSSTPPKTTVK
jgi:hypothetical protein